VAGAVDGAVAGAAASWGSAVTTGAGAKHTGHGMKPSSVACSNGTGSASVPTSSAHPGR